MSSLTLCVDISTSHSYEKVWELQKYLLNGAISEKRADFTFRPNYLLLCEHSPVYTLGKSGKPEHLLEPGFEGEKGKAIFHRVNRGGDITFHGPGQITGYIIFDMDHFYHDLHRFVRDIEEAIIISLVPFGLLGKRIEGLTGVWIVDNGTMKRKICAIGIHMSRWVSMHGFALNVNTDLSYYNGIVPCGIQDNDKEVTSIARELGHPVDEKAVKEAVRQGFKKVFNLNYI